MRENPRMMEKAGILGKENSMCKDSEAREYGMFRGIQRRSNHWIVKYEDRKMLF